MFSCKAPEGRTGARAEPTSISKGLSWGGNDDAEDGDSSKGYPGGVWGGGY